MAYISMFFCCKSVEMIDDDNPSLRITSPTNSFTIKHIPSLFSFSIVFELRDIDLNTPHISEIILSGEAEGEELIRQTLYTPIESDNAFREIQGYINLKNINIQTEGVYLCDIVLDGASLGKNRVSFTKERSVQ